MVVVVVSGGGGGEGSGGFLIVVDSHGDGNTCCGDRCFRSNSGGRERGRNI